LPLSTAELDAIYLTIALAGITTVLLVLIGTPLAWWLSRRRGTVPALVESLVAMPDNAYMAPSGWTGLGKE